MDVHPLYCPQCREPIGRQLINTGQWHPCPACGIPGRLEVFPALLKPLAAGQSPERILVEGEAGCFYHPDKRAVVPCGACGRFLCSLCDVELGEQHLCPACLQSNQQKGKLAELEKKRMLYDSAALYYLTLIPLLVVFPLFFVTLFTAPLAIGVALYSLGRPGSLIPRTRIRAWLAILLGVLQLAGWVAMVYFGFFSESG